MQIKIKPLVKDFKMPIQGSELAACHDVYAHSLEIKGDVYTYGLGFASEIPPGWKGLVFPRSSLSKTECIMPNSVGIIDADYRGEWKVVLKGKTTPYEVGERVAQICFERVNDVVLTPVDQLSDTVRGEGGFGHTGNK